MSRESSGKLPEKKKSARALYLELIRVYACLAVILIHTRGRGATRFLKYDPWTWDYIKCLLFTVYIRFAVPSFLAISGATLLSRKDESRKKMISRIVRIIIVIVIFSVLYYLDKVIPAGKQIQPLKFLALLYSSNMNFVIWYLYTYLAFLVSLPLLRPLAQNLSDKGFRYMFMLILVFGSLIPCLEVWLFKNQIHMNRYFNLSWMMGYLVAYPMLGYYFHNRLDPGRDLKDWWWVWPLEAAALVLTALTVGRALEINGSYSGAIFRTYVGKFDLLHTFSIFLLARCLCTRHTVPRWLEKAILSVASCVFGIYLIHIFFMEKGRLFVKLQTRLVKHGHLDGLLATVLVCMLVMAISYVITWILRRIPAVRKLL